MTAKAAPSSGPMVTLDVSMGGAQRSPGLQPLCVNGLQDEAFGHLNGASSRITDGMLSPHAANVTRIRTLRTRRTSAERAPLRSHHDWQTSRSWRIAPANRGTVRAR